MANCPRHDWVYLTEQGCPICRVGRQEGERATTVHGRVARLHDDGEHDGPVPFMHCARCEMEHPKGRFRTMSDVLWFLLATQPSAVRESLALADRDAPEIATALRYLLSSVPDAPVEP